MTTRSRPVPSFTHPAPPRPRPPAGPFGGTLGVMVVAFGIGVLGAYMLDMHSHVCESCGTKWRHLGAFNLGDLDAHTCKKCGTVQWWKCGWQSAMDPRSVDGAFRTTAKPPAYPGAVAALRQELREVPQPTLPSGWPPEPRR